MYKRFAELIAGRIEKSGVEMKASACVYSYGAEMLISSLGSILTVVALSLLFKEPLAGLVYYSAFSIQRSASGGFHASSHLKCYFSSLFYVLAFFVLLLSVPPSYFFAIAALSTLAAFVVIFILAPVGTPNKQLEKAEVAVCRKRSRIILVSETACVAALLALGQDKYAFVISNGLLLVAVTLIAGKVSLKRYLRGAQESGA